MSALDVIRTPRGKFSIYFKTLVRKWLKVYLKFDWTINDTCFKGVDKTRNMEHGTWNMEHGTFRNIPEHEKIKVIFMKKKIN